MQNTYLNMLFKSLIIILAAFILSSIVKHYFKRAGKKLKKKSSVEETRIKGTRINFLRIILTSSIYLLAFVQILFLIPGFKAFSISILAGAGIIAIVLGFAAQKTLSNIISGISIAIFTPFRIGDRLKIGDELGDVEEMNLRHTVIKTWDNRRIIVPNSLIAEKEVINYSIKEERMLWTVNMGISYDSDIDKAKKIMLDKANKHPEVIVPEVKDDKGEIEKKEPMVKVTECGDFAVNLRLYFWVAAPKKAWFIGYELTEEIKKEFDKQGIEIPFPYRTIVYKKDLDEKKKKR